MEVSRYVDQERLREDIKANAAFGAIDADDGRGRTVSTGSNADRKARDRFINQLESIGLDVRIDAVGNIVGRWSPSSNDADSAPIAIGSHLDSVPRGGIFDGVLGVYAGLEVVRALQESDVEPVQPIEVVSFTEEEGYRFGQGLLGSSVAAGRRSAEEALGLEDDKGVTLRDALEDIGYAGEGQLRANNWTAWAELHIEQGTRLEKANSQVGIVDAITGISNCRAIINGEADHAGGTPMVDRTDALTAASELVLAVERAAQQSALSTGTAVGTVGTFDVEPNARNIVPGRVETTLDVRDVSYEAMNEIIHTTQQELDTIAERRKVDVDFQRYREQQPSQMSNDCLAAARKAAQADDVEYLDMHSAAMHDTANIADVTETLLLFAQSRDGISHNPREWTDWSDCAAATSVLAETIARLIDSE